MDDVKTNDLGDIILETRGLTKHYGGVHALGPISRFVKANMLRSLGIMVRENQPLCVRSQVLSSAQGEILSLTVKASISLDR